MREGPTLIHGKLPSREGCISDYLGYSAPLTRAATALHLLMCGPICAVLGFILVLLMPGAIIALPLAVLAVAYLCYALAIHWIEHSTAAPCHPEVAAKLRSELTAKLPWILLLLPVTLIRGVFAWLAHPNEWGRCWHSYLTYPDNPNGAPGMFESPAGTVKERVRRYYVVGAIVAMAAFHVAPADGPLSMVALFIVAPTLILTFLVPTLFIAPLFHRLLSADQSSHFERALLLKHSPNPTEARSIPLGTLVADGSPVLMLIKTLATGLHLLGAPGSGKSMTLAYLAEYFLARLRSSVHFVDCKDQNSMELFEAMRIGAERAGVPFYYVTTDPTKASFTYNVFRQAFFRRMTPMQKASFIGAVLGCTHGLEGYGPKFFGGNALSILIAVFTHHEIRSWSDLAEKIRLVRANPRAYGLDKETAKAATELINDVLRLASIPVLNSDLEGIDLCDGMPKAVYYTFPGAYDVTGAFGRLIAFSLFAAADSASEGQPMTWLIIDEVQRVLGDRMETLIQQSREKVGLIFANQSMEDLIARDHDYRHTIRTCLRTRWELNLPDKRDQALQAESSGKVIRERESVSVTTTRIPGLTTTLQTLVQPRVMTSSTHTFSEYEANRYGVNEVSLINSDDTLSLMTCAQDGGFIQWGGFPQVVRLRPHITLTEYERRKRAVWPKGGPDTITPGIPEPKGPPQLPAPKAPTIINPGTEQRESRRSRRRRRTPPPNPPLA